MTTSANGSLLASTEHIGTASFHGSASRPRIRLRNAIDGKILASAEIKQNMFISSLIIADDGSAIAAITFHRWEYSQAHVWEVVKEK